MISLSLGMGGRIPQTRDNWCPEESTEGREITTGALERPVLAPGRPWAGCNPWDPVYVLGCSSSGLWHSGVERAGRAVVSRSALGQQALLHYTVLHSTPLRAPPWNSKSPLAPSVQKWRVKLAGTQIVLAFASAVLMACACHHST